MAAIMYLALLVVICCSLFVDAFAPRNALFGSSPHIALVVSMADDNDGAESSQAGSPSEVVSGPKADPGTFASRRRRSSSPSTLGRRRPAKSTAGTGRRRTPAPVPGQYAVATKRAPHQYDHRKEEARPFVDGRTEIALQRPNEDAPVFSLPEGTAPGENGNIISHDHIKTTSLDDLFPGLSFSDMFASSSEFRADLRSAMREDIFDSTPAYFQMSEKARKMLLLPDSSLQGSWKCQGGRWERKGSTDSTNGKGDTCTGTDHRMKKLTQVLSKYLGEGAPTGDQMMDTIGALCGSNPSTHWIDIVGVQDRRIPHSWHQDTGRSPNGTTMTVLLGFPPDDDHDNVGVFSHCIKLEREQFALEEHPINEPIVYPSLEVEEKFIVRPKFAKGREIIFYRDVDVLHSSPDVAWRASVMRFM